MPLHWGDGRDLPGSGKLRPLVLGRPGEVHAELPGRLQGPVGVAQQLAGQKDRVGEIRGDDLLGLDRLGDETDGAGSQACPAADGGGEGGLKPGAVGTSASGTSPALEQSMRSTPSAFRRWQKATDCSRSQPPLTQSLAEMRTKRGS